MKKRHVTAIVICILCSIGFIIWTISGETKGIQQKQLHTMLTNGETRIDLQQIAPFQWDDVDAFGPYSTTETIRDAFNIQLRPLFGGIDVLENEFLLVFVRNDKIIAKHSLSREHGDYYVEDGRYLVVQK